MRGLKRDELIAGLRRLQRAGGGLAGADQGVDLGVGVGKVLNRARLDDASRPEIPPAILPAGLRVGHQVAATRCRPDRMTG